MQRLSKQQYLSLLHCMLAMLAMLTHQDLQPHTEPLLYPISGCGTRPCQGQAAPAGACADAALMLPVLLLNICHLFDHILCLCDQGKVRDTYELDDKIVIVTTDRCGVNTQSQSVYSHTSAGCVQLCQPGLLCRTSITRAIAHECCKSNLNPQQPAPCCLPACCSPHLHVLACAQHAPTPEQAHLQHPSHNSRHTF